MIRIIIVIIIVIIIMFTLFERSSPATTTFPEPQPALALQPLAIEMIIMKRKVTLVMVTLMIFHENGNYLGGGLVFPFPSPATFMLVLASKI